MAYTWLSPMFLELFDPSTFVESPWTTDIQWFCPHTLGRYPKTSPFTPKKKEFLHIQPVVVSHPFGTLNPGFVVLWDLRNPIIGSSFPKKKTCRYMTIIFPVALEGKTSGLCWVPWLRRSGFAAGPFGVFVRGIFVGITNGFNRD